ncbi:tetratricopeptide repeat protein, partial [bacterium]|nr:tetratricopeptide repeat protein [bacterium]
MLLLLLVFAGNVKAESPAELDFLQYKALNIPLKASPGFIYNLDPFDLDPDFWESYQMISGYYYFKGKDYLNSVSAFSKVIHSQLSNNEKEWLFFWKGLALSESRDHELIREYFGKPQELNWGQFWHANYLFSVDSSEKAIIALEELLERPKLHDMLKLKGGYLLGLTYFKLKDYKKSTEIFKDCSELYPGNVLEGELNYNLGLIKFKEGDYDEAMVYLNNSIEFYGRSRRKDAHWWIDETQILLAIVYFKLGDYERSLGLLAQMEDTGNRDSLEYMQEIEYYQKLIGLISQAAPPESVIAQIEGLRESYAFDLYFKTGYQFYQRGLFKQAQNYWLESLMFNISAPLKEQVLFFLGEAFYRTRDFSTAEEYYRLSLNYSRDYTYDTYYGLAWSLYRQRDYNDARELFRIIADSTEWPLAEYSGYIYARSFYITKSYSRAIRELGSFERAFPASKYKNDVRYLIAECWNQLGEFQAAAEAYMDVCEQLADNKHLNDAFLKAVGLFFDLGYYGRVISLVDSLA